MSHEPPDLDFHHFGVACRDLDRESQAYALLGYHVEGDDFEDGVQGVRGRFLVGGGPRMELLVPLSGRDVLEPWLAGGSRIYHQAFMTSDLDAALRALSGAGGRTVVAPVPAAAFQGRRICFVMLRTMSLVELIDSPAGDTVGPAVVER
ncbi:VOC family protein [Blastococcus litoris]|uniref:VOC family protein n=1 Tax=Blastococcus litoris TaxID=2171622 RepID=UPI000E307E1F|nr:VOC family protein [Blastococcus litoris]